MSKAFWFFLIWGLVIPARGTSAQAPAPPPPMSEHQHDGMSMDAEGAVMNENKDRLPQDCQRISRDYTFTVRVGKKYALKFPGTMFAYDQQEWNVEPCSRVTVTLINEDHVRHQWMLHGLPKYLYPQGMFHMEVSGPAQKTGTFIVPKLKRTYFVHCDMAQHTEKGLRGQLKAGGGDGDLPSVPGISGQIYPDVYQVEWNRFALAGIAIAGLFGAVLAVFGLKHLGGMGRT